MTELTPCPACKRHVEVAETSCPFCSSALRATSAQHIALAGRVSRAAMFSAALAACSGSKPEPAKPPMLDLAGTGTSTPDAGVPDAAVADAAVAQAPADAAAGPRPPDVPVYERRPPNKPYGAPPARKRIV